MVAIAVMYNVVWRYAVARGLLRPDVDPEGMRRASRGYLAGPTGYTAITLIALVNAWSVWPSSPSWYCTGCCPRAALGRA